MVKIILDTKALFDYLAGKESVVEKVKQYIGREELCITSLTLFDIITSLKNENIALDVMESFIILDVDKDCAIKARELYLYIEENRKPNVKEMITAACCIINNGYLLTSSKKEYVDVLDLKMA